MMKLDPSTPNLLIPKLLDHVELKKNMDEAIQVRKIVGSKYQHANQSFFETTNKLVKTQRGHWVVELALVVPTITDCGKCKMCMDKPKFGGPGKQNNGVYWESVKTILPNHLWKSWLTLS